MVRLSILLKNGKKIETVDVPLMQAIEWRERLRKNERERVIVLTMNGKTPLEGCWIKSYSLKGKVLSTDEAASAMYLEPYTIYCCEGNYYQYSLIGKGFERARKHNEYFLWDLSALPAGSWTRIGKDVL